MWSAQFRSLLCGNKYAASPRIRYQNQGAHRLPSALLCTPRQRSLLAPCRKTRTLIQRRLEHGSVRPSFQPRRSQCPLVREYRHNSTHRLRHSRSGAAPRRPAFRSRQDVQDDPTSYRHPPAGISIPHRTSKLRPRSRRRLTGLLLLSYANHAFDIYEAVLSHMRGCVKHVTVEKDKAAAVGTAREDLHLRRETRDGITATTHRRRKITGDKRDTRGKTTEGCLLLHMSSYLV